VVMAATAAFAVIAAGGWPGSWPFARLLGAMLGGQLAIGAVNELVDIELDRVAKPHKPLASGVVPVRGARVMAAAGIMAMVPLSATFGGRSLVLCSLGTGLGIAYSLWFKRSMWSWLPYALERLDYEWEDQFKDLLPRPPSEYWRRQFYATFQIDRIGLRNLDAIGAETVMWGSDFPHPDGTWPDSLEILAPQLTEITPAQQRLILFENARRLYGFPMSG